jgi:hypothetical protein
VCTIVGLDVLKKKKSLTKIMCRTEKHVPAEQGATLHNIISHHPCICLGSKIHKYHKIYDKLRPVNLKNYVISNKCHKKKLKMQHQNS